MRGASAEAERLLGRRSADRRRRRASARAGPAARAPVSARRPRADERAVLAAQRHEVGDRRERHDVELALELGGVAPGRARRAPGRACRRRRSRTAPRTDSRRRPGARSGSRAARRRGGGGRSRPRPSRARARARPPRPRRSRSPPSRAGPRPRACSSSTVRARQPVAVLRAARQARVHVGAEVAQRAHQHRRRADAVDVVVAVHARSGCRAGRGRASSSTASRMPSNANGSCGSAASRKRRAAPGRRSPRRTSTVATRLAQPELARRARAPRAYGVGSRDCQRAVAA